MTTSTMYRKAILGAVLVGALALAGMDSAGARPWGGGPGWSPACDNCPAGLQTRQADEKTIAARNKFLSETVAVRREMTVKRAEQEALLQSENPDAKRIAQLTGEIFDLREQLLTKAKEYGLDGPGFGGCHCLGAGMDPGPGPGAGPDGPGKPE